MTGIKISFLVTKVFQKWNNGLGVIYILILTSLFCEMALALSDWTDIGPPGANTLWL